MCTIFSTWLSVLDMQVIALTEELLESAKQNEKSELITGTGSDVSNSLHHPEGVPSHYLVNLFSIEIQLIPLCIVGEFVYIRLNMKINKILKFYL